MKTLAALAVSLLLASAASGVNVIVNPGFETGSLDPFYQAQVVQISDPWHVVSTQPHSGSFCATNAGLAELRQDFAPISTNDITEISFWIRNLDSGAARANRYTFYYSDGWTYSTTVVQPNGAWNYTSITDALLFDKSLVAFSVWGYLGSESDRTYIDDLVIDVIPAPGPLALIGIAFVALAHRSRR